MILTLYKSNSFDISLSNDSENHSLEEVISSIRIIHITKRHQTRNQQRPLWSHEYHNPKMKLLGSLKLALLLDVYQRQ